MPRSPSLMSLFLVAMALDATAQAPVPDGLARPTAELLEEADALYASGRVDEAYDLLAERAAAVPTDDRVVWRLLRSAAVASFYVEDDHRAENRFLDPALYFAEQAVERRTGEEKGVYWRAVAAGRRALNAGARNAGHLSQVVYEDALWLLAADSTDADAHNLIGKLAYEVMSLSRFERTAARLFVGSPVLGAVSWDTALDHLTEAVRLRPRSALFRFDLAALYVARGWPRQAVDQLGLALTLPAREPVDPAVRRMARALLAELER